MAVRDRWGQVMARRRKAGTPEPKKWTVFVSHAGTDTWVARQIAGHLKGAGAVPFLDEADIAVGEDFEHKILTALHEANELLVLLTPWSLRRPYVWLEVGVAWSRHIPIVGVVYGLTLESLRADTSVPNLLKERDLTDLNGLDDYFGQLQRRIAGEA
jgi:hypothetical protein